MEDIPEILQDNSWNLFEEPHSLILSSLKETSNVAYGSVIFCIETQTAQLLSLIIKIVKAKREYYKEL